MYVRQQSSSSIDSIWSLPVSSLIELETYFSQTVSNKLTKGRQIKHDEGIIHKTIYPIVFLFIL